MSFGTIFQHRTWPGGRDLLQFGTTYSRVYECKSLTRGTLQLEFEGGSVQSDVSSSASDVERLDFPLVVYGWYS